MQIFLVWYGTRQTWNFLFSVSGFGCNTIIFDVDMSSSVYVDNKKKDILILGIGPTQGLDGTTLTVEKK